MKILQREDPFQPFLKGKNAGKITDPFFFSERFYAFPPQSVEIVWDLASGYLKLSIQPYRRVYHKMYSFLAWVQIISKDFFSNTGLRIALRAELCYKVLEEEK